MAPRTGRPRTGRKPNFIVRMNPEHAAAARQSARDAGKQVGQWLEEAITEKQEREKEAGNVTKPDWELGISPAYLSYMLNGKRPWRKDLYQRYMGVVNTFVNNEGDGVNSQTKRPPQLTVSSGVITAGGGEGNRTPGPLHAKQVLSR